METYERTLRKLRKCLYIYIGETRRGDLGIFAAKSFRSGDLIMVDEDGDYYDNVCTSKQVIDIRFGFDNTFQVNSDGFKLQNGNIDDFTNHSCSPTTGIRLTPKGTIVLAIRDITPHEELTYDYSTYIDNPYDGFPCDCAEPNCRGFVSDFKSLPIERQRAYLDMNIVGAFVRGTEAGKARSGGLVQA